MPVFWLGSRPVARRSDRLSWLIHDELVVRITMLGITMTMNIMTTKTMKMMMIMMTDDDAGGGGGDEDDDDDYDSDHDDLE